MSPDPGAGASIANGPLVSVIMPAYNAEAYIARSIESVRAQTLTDFELIIVDDCSTDGTAGLINRHAQAD
ncbi:MAG: glycosyltransferase, partial [Dokdonella sp.]